MEALKAVVDMTRLKNIVRELMFKFYTVENEVDLRNVIKQDYIQEYYPYRLTHAYFAFNEASIIVGNAYNKRIRGAKKIEHMMIKEILNIVKKKRK